LGQAGRPGEIGKSGAVPTCIVGPAPILSESERASGADADGLEKKDEKDETIKLVRLVMLVVCYAPPAWMLMA
jgi:hypothetical protein